MKESQMIIIQKNICQKYGFNFVKAPLDLKIGISDNVKQGIEPINGLRHLPYGETTGWYIWAGEYSTAPDFFKPLHVKHVQEWSQLILPFLGLEPGCRFLISEGGNYVDVWKDNSLLHY